MNGFIECTPEMIRENSFNIVGPEGLLVSAEYGGHKNAMTAAWGGLGKMWGKNIAEIVLRPQRFTKPLIDKSGFFGLSFLPFEKYDSQLNYFGSVSGRDEDKIAKSGLKTDYYMGVPYFLDSRLVIICRTLFSQPMKEENFIDRKIVETWYPLKDFHVLYIGEIIKVFEKA